MTPSASSTWGADVRGDSIFIHRRHKSRANADSFPVVARLLSKVLAPLAQQRRVPMTLAAAPVNVIDKVARACPRAKIFLTVLPLPITAWVRALAAHVLLRKHRPIGLGTTLCKWLLCLDASPRCRAWTCSAGSIHRAFKEIHWAWIWASAPLRTRTPGKSTLRSDSWNATLRALSAQGTCQRKHRRSVRGSVVGRSGLGCCVAQPDCSMHLLTLARVEHQQCSSEQSLQQPQTMFIRVATYG